MSLKEYNLKKLLVVIEFFFIAFIVIQPLLDLVAYFGTDLSLVFRVFAMAIGYVYLLIYPNQKIRRYATIYIIIVGIFMVLNTALNYFLKDPYFLVQEVTYAIKIIYVIEMLLVYTAVFLSIKKRMDWEKTIQRAIFFNLSVIGVVMLLATITDTGNRSYGTAVKQGHSGWFYSANDLSAILAISFGVMLLYLLQAKSKKWLYVPFLLLAAWAMMTVGTKVGLGALIIGLVAALFLTIIRLFLKKGNWHNPALIVLTLILSLAYIPYSAIGNNIGITFFQQTESHSTDSKEKTSTIAQQDMTYKVMSGRELFLKNVVSYYNEAPLLQKIFGMGPGGNYKEKLKLIEMDFLDWFYGYGPVGFLLLMLPLLFFFVMILKKMFQNVRLVFTPSFFMVALSLVLALGIASVAGHILLNPASGIYFAILVGYLYTISVAPSEN